MERAKDGVAKDEITEPIISLRRQSAQYETYVDLLNWILLLLTVLAIKDCSPVLVQLNGGNNDVARVDANGGRRAVRLVPLHTVNVDNPLLAVDLGNLALPALVLAPDDPDLVILANWQ